MLNAFRTGRTMPRMLVLAMIACALLMRMVVPPGWMPVHGADGWTVALCSGTGPMRMTMSDGPGMSKGMQHKPDGKDQGSADHPCAFANFALALDLPPLPGVELLPPIAETWRAGTALAVAIGRGLAAPPPPSTGPPTFL